jgi:3-methylfumaryl-CoA hydratase
MSVAEKPYTDWIGNTEAIEDTISPSPARLLQMTLDDTRTTIGNGDPLPPIWHWCYFLEAAPQSTLGPDGHPPRGGFMPPVALPRRMFAGGRSKFIAPLRIGAPARQTAEIKSVVEKEGRSGQLCFVTVTYTTEQDGTTCIEEGRDYVYREEGAPVSAPEPVELPPVPEGSWSRTITPDPVMLFRYSALTFNGHRIHYDQPYVTQVEHYPGLIVHGPLIATSLLELVRRNQDRPVVGFSFQARSPIFDLAPFRVVAVPGEGDDVDLKAEGPDGTLSMQATATLG